MARTVVPTSKAGDVLTAAWQNTYVKNNEAWHYQMLTPRNLWIGGWRPRETAAAGGPAVLTAGSNYFDYLAFDKDRKEYEGANIPMPLNYNGGTITAKVYWSHPATTTNCAVAWKIAAIALTMRKRPGIKTQDISAQVRVRREDRVKLVSMEAEKD